MRFFCSLFPLDIAYVLLDLAFGGRKNPMICRPGCVDGNGDAVVGSLPPVCPLGDLLWFVRRVFVFDRVAFSAVLCRFF